MIGVVEINEVSLTFQFGKWDALNANQSILRSSEMKKKKKLGKKTFDNGILCDKLSDVENSISSLDFFLNALHTWVFWVEYLLPEIPKCYKTLWLSLLGVLKLAKATLLLTLAYYS